MYKQCPFCDRVFEIGETDHRPMKAHIRAEHADPDDAGGIGPSTEKPSRPERAAD